jgi:hypothetical protein
LVEIILPASLRPQTSVLTCFLASRRNAATLSADKCSHLLPCVDEEGGDAVRGLPAKRDLDGAHPLDLEERRPHVQGFSAGAGEGRERADGLHDLKGRKDSVEGTDMMEAEGTDG